MRPSDYINRLYSLRVVTLAPLLAAPMLMAILLRAVGKNPVSIFWAIIVSGFGSPLGLTETITRMTPIFLCALAVAIPAKTGLFNIGGEGQLHCGAIAATIVALFIPWLPHFMVIPSMILAAMIGGALWGVIPGLLRAKFQVNEILVSLMLNYVAIFIVDHLVHGPWRDPEAFGWPYAAPFPEWAVLPTFGKSNIHLGLVLGFVVVCFVYLVLRYTTWGFSLRLIEANPRTARYVNINAARYIVILMAVGGAMAALAGLGEVSVIQNRLRPGISPGYGYTGFLVAWLARNNPIAIVPVAFLVGGLYSGADVLQLTAGLPSATVDIFVGLTFLTFLVGESLWRTKVSVVEEAK
jgi:general nucleoside transport system permease protein